MKKFKLVLVAVLAFLALFAFGQPSQSHAASKTKITYYSVKNHNYKLTGNYYYLYSKPDLKTKDFKAKHSTTFESSKRALVKTGSKEYTAAYVTSSKQKGWLNVKGLKEVGGSTSSTSTTPVVPQKPSVTADQLNSLIQSSPDLDPTGQLLNLNAADYSTYNGTLRKNFNLTPVGGTTGTFTNHQQTVTARDAALAPYVQMAVNNWNQALGSQVFTYTSDQNAQLTFYLVSKAGLITGRDDATFTGPYAQIDSDTFDWDASHITKNPGYDYWTGVCMQMLGNDLGLQPTPYVNDIMGISDSSLYSGGNFKYSWSSIKENGSNALDYTGALSQRDVDRAKLAKAVGLW